MAALLVLSFLALLLDSLPQRSRPPAPLLAFPLADLAPGGSAELQWAGRRLLLWRRAEAAAQGKRPDLLAVIGIGPGSGCPVDFIPPATPGAPRSPWPGGFRDRCNGDWYDAAGEPLAGGRRLTIVPHRLSPDGRQLLIGEE